MDLTITPDDAKALDAILNNTSVEQIAAGHADHVKRLVDLIREASVELSVSSHPEVGLMARLAKGTVLEGPGGQPTDPMLVQPLDGSSDSLQALGD